MNRHLKEPFIAYAATCAVNYFWFPEDPAFLSLELHPFLFITVLLSIRYGIYEGMISAFLGAGLLTWATFGKYDMLEMELLYGIQHLILPIALLFFGIVIGEITEGRMKKMSFYQGALKREVASNMDKTKEVMGLEKSLIEVERKLAGHGMGIRDFSEQLINMLPLNREEMLRDIPNILKRFLGVEQAIILDTRDDLYEPKLISSTALPPNHETLKALCSSEMFIEAIHQKRAISLTEIIGAFEPDDKLENPIYYSGVILDDGDIQGIVLVLKIPFIQFNITNFRLFDVVLKMAGMVIQNAESYQRVINASPYHQLWLVEREHHFLKQLREIGQFQEDGIGVLLVGFTFKDHTPESMKIGFMTLISQLSIKTGARVGVLGKEECFVLHHPLKTPQQIKEILSTRYQGYGISTGFAQIKIIPLLLSLGELQREFAFQSHLMTERFHHGEAES